MTVSMHFLTGASQIDSFQSVKDTHPALDLVLQIFAASTDDSALCRCLIVANANPNAKDVGGRTSLQIAIVANAWLTCKALIDNGANRTVEDNKAIDNYLMHQRVEMRYWSVFKTPFPNPYIPEIFIEGTGFQPLSKQQLQLQPLKPQSIALFAVADESIGPHYGPVARAFTNEDLSNYEFLNEQRFAVIRVRVDDRNALSSAIDSAVDKMHETLPELPLTFLCLEGHADETGMEIGNGSILEKFHELTMHEIAKRVCGLGTIVLKGCKCAKGDSNLAQTFSCNAPRRIVLGTPDSSTRWTLTSFPLSFLNMIQVVPFFQNYSEHDGEPFPPKTRAYKDGIEVASGTKDMNVVIATRVNASLAKVYWLGA